MTGRERLIRALKGEPVDRVPVAPFLYYNNVYELFGFRPGIEDFHDPEDFDAISKLVEYCDHYGFDILHPLAFVWDHYTSSTLRDRSVFRSWENWDVQVADEHSARERLRRIRVRTPRGELHCVERHERCSPYLVVSALQEHLIKTPRDFEILRAFAPPPEDMDCSLIRRVRAAVGDRGLVCSGINGAFNLLNRFRRLEELFMDPLQDEGFYREMMEFFLQKLLLRVRRIAASGADVLEQTANLATSAVGPRFYERYVLPYEQRLARGIHEAGALVILHNCGDAARIMHLYNELDIDCWGYLTPPPYGDVQLEEALRVMRRDLTLRGNVDQVEFLPRASPAEVERRVRELLLSVKPRGNWILSTTDFLSDGTPPENIRAFARAGRDYGVYEEAS